MRTIQLLIDSNTNKVNNTIRNAHSLQEQYSVKNDSSIVEPQMLWPLHAPYENTDISACLIGAFGPITVDQSLAHQAITVV